MNTTSKKQALTSFVRRNLVPFAIILSSIAFVLKDALELEKTGKSLWAIISFGFATYLFAIYICMSFHYMAESNAKTSELYLQTMEYYGIAKSSIKGRSYKLPKYCIYKTKIAIETKQREILEEECLNYAVFKENKYKDKELTENEKKALERARKVPQWLEPLRAQDLLSERTRKRINDNPLSLGEDKYTHDRNVLLKKTVKKLGLPIIFGYFTISAIHNDNVVYSLVQLGLMLMGGVLDYLNSEDWILNIYRNRFVAKAEYLNEFIELDNKDPLMFEPINEKIN